MSPISNCIVLISLLNSYELESTADSKDAWRRLPEVPSVEELLRERVDLPVNVIDSPYDTVDDYLEAHYELLREDAFAGLREAVGYIRQYPKGDDTQEIAIYDYVSQSPSSLLVAAPHTDAVNLPRSVYLA
jgi:helicase required for RNAi-mediated heterochromatin assembly 1